SRLKESGRGQYVREDHAFREAFGTERASSIRECVAKGLPIMRQKFAHVRKDSPAFVKYMGSDVLWDEVVKVRRVGRRRTYDLGVNRLHNFVADDFLVHNTFCLLDVAYRAMTQRRRVAYFQVGDLSKVQVERRL